MKRLFCLVLCLVTLMFFGCTPAGDSSETTEPTVQLESFCDGSTLKVLAIGNSFSNNTTNYLYDIAKAEGMTEVVIGRLYFGACSVERHARNARNNVAEYTYYKNTTGVWEQTENFTLLQGLQDEDWDIITLQQSSGNSGLPGTYETCLDELIAYVNENKTNPDAKLLWHMTWAYQADSDHKDFANYSNDQEKMYNSIVQTVQLLILPNEAFAGVIPAGTAVQNARTSYFKDNLTMDGYHLNTLGEVITGYTWYATFVGKTLDEVKLTQVTDSFTLSDSNKEVIVETVNNALKNPYEVTQSQIQ